MRRSLAHLKMSESGPHAGLARYLNRIVDELERAANIEVTSPLLLRDNGQQGKTIGLMQTNKQGGGGGSTVTVDNTYGIAIESPDVSDVLGGPRRYFMSLEMPSVTLTRYLFSCQGSGSFTFEIRCTSGAFGSDTLLLALNESSPSGNNVSLVVPSSYGLYVKFTSVDPNRYNFFLELSV